MKKITIGLVVLMSIAGVCFAQSAKQFISFEQLFPKAMQREMGLHKLTDTEKEKLRAHVEQLLIRVIASSQSSRKAYARLGGGHWIKKNVDSGTFIILEDGSLWQIDPLDKVDAMLWLPVSNITVVESSSGSPGYDYLLINTDDGETAHAKYMGHE